MDKWVNNIGIGNTLVGRRLIQSGLSKEDLIIKKPVEIRYLLQKFDPFHRKPLYDRVLMAIYYLRDDEFINMINKITNYQPYHSITSDVGLIRYHPFNNHKSQTTAAVPPLEMIEDCDTKVLSNKHHTDSTFISNQHDDLIDLTKDEEITETSQNDTLNSDSIRMYPTSKAAQIMPPKYPNTKKMSNNVGSISNHHHDNMNHGFETYNDSNDDNGCNYALELDLIWKKYMNNRN